MSNSALISLSDLPRSWLRSAVVYVAGAAVIVALQLIAPGAGSAFGVWIDWFVALACALLGAAHLAVAAAAAVLWAGFTSLRVSLRGHCRAPT
jgi:hypothetical protein